MSDPLSTLLDFTTILLVTKPKASKKKGIIVNQKRTPKAVSKSTKDTLDLVRVDPKTFPVGSYKFRAHLYPSDIDIFEIIERCCSVPTATRKMIFAFKNMARKIQKRKDIFLGDFKAGLDTRFDFDYGELKFRNGKAFVVGYKPNVIKSKLKSFKDDKLISDKEYNDTIKLVKSRLSPSKFYQLQHNILREFKVVRWTLRDIINGKKKIRGGKTLTLKEAITHDTIVKIDIWAKVDNRYIEITNFFLLVVKDKRGKRTVLNEKLKDRMIALNSDINKYSSTTFRNSLKLAKRYWNKAAWLKDNRTMDKLYPLFRSGTSSLNQIAEDAGMIATMLESGTHPPLSDLYEQVDDFKRRIDDIFDIKFKRENMYKLIDNTIRKQKTKNTINQMNKLVSDIKQIVEYYAYQYMSNLGIVKGRYKKVVEELEKEEKTYPDLSGLAN